MLKIENLTKKYGKQVVLRDLTMAFEPGIYALLGPNGAGKSTLLNCIAQVISYNGGSILYKGEATRDNSNFFKDFGYLPQTPSFYPNYNAKEMLMYLGYLKGIEKSELKTSIPKLLKSVNLPDVGKKHIGAYSGGMRQRLGIAQSLLNDPKVLILDEPMSGLDPKERVRFRNLIASLSANRIIIIATHIVSDIVSIADKVLIFDGGEVIQEGSVESLCQSIEGQVFNVKVDDQSLLEGLNVSDLVYRDNTYFAKIVGDSRDLETAAADEVTLEDVYLYHFGGYHDNNSL